MLSHKAVRQLANNKDKKASVVQCMSLEMLVITIFTPIWLHHIRPADP